MIRALLRAKALLAALVATVIMIPVTGLGVASAALYQITINVTSAQTTFSFVGEQVTVTITATNAGTNSLNDAYITSTPAVTLTGASCRTESNKLPTFASAATFQCTATITITQADLDAGSIQTQFNAKGSHGSPPNVVTENATLSPDATSVDRPAIDLVKSVTSGSPFARAGDKIAYSLKATNTGNLTLTNVTINDPLLGGKLTNCTPSDQNPGPTLAPGASVTCTATYTVTQADVDAGKVDNTATTKGTPPRGLPDVTDTDSKSVPGNSPAAIDLVKKADPTTYTAAGQKITYTLVATNTGAVTLSNVTITDPKLGALTCVPSQPTTLAPGAKLSCTGSYTITDEDMQTAEVKNTAKVTGQPPGNKPPVTDEDTAIVTGPVADLAITKTHKPASVTSGADVTFTLTVKNNGPGTSYGVKVTDTLPTGLTYVSATGPGWNCSNAAQLITCTLASPLANGASTEISVVATVTATSGQVINVAVVDSKTKDPNPDNNRAEDSVGVAKAKRVCPPGTVTKAGDVVIPGCRSVNIRALCRVKKPSVAGDVSYCKVRVRKNGSVKVISRTDYPVKVKVVWSAPATEEYAAFRQVKRYTI